MRRTRNCVARDRIAGLHFSARWLLERMYSGDFLSSTSNGKYEHRGGISLFLVGLYHRRGSINDHCRQKRAQDRVRLNIVLVATGTCTIASTHSLLKSFTLGIDQNDKIIIPNTKSWSEDESRGTSHTKMTSRLCKTQRLSLPRNEWCERRDILFFQVNAE